MKSNDKQKERKIPQVQFIRVSSPVGKKVKMFAVRERMRMTEAADLLITKGLKN